MNRPVLALATFLPLFGLAACSGAPEGADAGVEGGDGAVVDPGADGGTRPGTDGATIRTDGGGSTDPDGAVTDPEPLRIVSATARGSGERGDDLLVTVIGESDDADAARIALRALGHQGEERILFDSDGDGLADSAEEIGWLDENVDGETSFTAHATRIGLGASELAIGRFAITLIDADGDRSNTVTVALEPQPVKQLDELCDPTFALDRCDFGLGCYGDPATCHEGIAPEVTRFAYLRTGEGSVLLFEGTEPDNDLAAMHLEFLDASGAPVYLDLDNDLSPDAATFDVDAEGSSRDGEFFFRVDPTADFATLVAQVAATPIDRGAREGARVVAALADPTVRSSGQSCHPLGFDTCATGLVCSPGTPGIPNTCRDPSASRTQQCFSTPRLDPARPTGPFVGVAEGASLWDPPAGCAANEPYGRPEGIAVLRLRTAATRLVITTDRPETNFDTILYLIPRCQADPQPAIACDDDDATTTASTIELENVPAGEYLIVVDAYGSTGGSFGLTISAE
ncbi:hypothetical protein L6R52_37125 [Myxococcota bacterium]|nr:hypothetical protein [Myxococcota bacterium]